MKKCMFLFVLLAVSLNQLEAKVNLEKTKEKLIGQWQFYREFCFRPSQRNDFSGFNDYYRLGKDKCVENLVYSFRSDGTFTATKTDKKLDTCNDYSGYWTVVETKDAQGKEHPAVEFRREQDSRIPDFSIMLVNVSGGYFISTFIQYKTPDGTKVSDMWFNYYKRYPISAEDQKKFKN